jgi:uncharacterized protein (TIGR01244 family)
MKRIDDRFYFAGEVSLEDIATLPSQGIAGLVNARPDGESASQPGDAAERTTSESAGLTYHFIPVKVDSITEEDVKAFDEALAKTDGPVLAHCGSGRRALMLWALAEVIARRLEPSLVGDVGARAGVDLSGVEAWLRAHRPDLLRRRRACVQGFYEARTSSVQYVVSDPDTQRCAIIDPVLDYDEKSGSTATRSADAILAYIRQAGLTVDWILDTHPHADHFSAAHYLKNALKCPTAIGTHVKKVQALWKDFYHLGDDFRCDGSQWDTLFNDGDQFKIGNLNVCVMHSPGHTLASITYVVEDAAFIHDTLFMPDSGSARADFPGGDAAKLWHSIQAILALPGDTRLLTGHDYRPGGRSVRWESTVDEQLRDNRHVAGLDEAAFVSMRQERDATLPMPKLILHALQVNIRAGQLPEPEADGHRFLKLPLDRFNDVPW